MNRVIEGLMVIAKYDPDSNFESQHDQIWFGSYTDTKFKMTDDELAKLAELGFWEDEDSWTAFT